MKKMSKMVLIASSAVLALIALFVLRGPLLDTSEFMPHGHCYLWQPEIVILHVASDSLIFLAYTTIPVTLGYILKRRKDIPFSWMVGLFGAFIIFCGMTHALEVLNLWKPYYWLSGGVKVITALASMGTAVLLVKLVPTILAIPSPDKMQEALEEKVQAQERLATFAHSAGKAQVAAGVLHGIGNILGVVKARISSLSRLLQKSEVGTLMELKAMIGEQDPLKFLNEHPQGGDIIRLFLSAAGDIQNGHAEMVPLLVEANRNIDDIANSIALQQEHAKAVGALEQLSITKLVDGALQLNAIGNQTYDITIVRQYDEIPEFKLDKYRILHILMVLLSNARHAVQNMEGEKKIVVQVALQGDWVAISVKDNGIGIAPENIAKMCTWGYTTKGPEGNGFGLHYSAHLARRNLGGDLTVHSDGLGCGAVFTLSFPLQAKEKEET